MSHKQLTPQQRYSLYEMNKIKMLQKDMAIVLGVSAPTISRELRRNKGVRGEYLKSAHAMSLERRTGKSKPRISLERWAQIEDYLREDLSPEQVFIRLKKLRKPCVSPEWIYQYIDRDQENGGDLHTHLRGKRKHRKRYGVSRKPSQIPDRVSIHERPSAVDKRSRYGDFEVDTVIGRQGGKVLVTLVERKSKLSFIGLSDNKKAESVKEVIIKLLKKISSCVRTLTYDNGPEFSQHKAIDIALKTQGYFADAYASWQRGLSENTNGLIRQYLPKKTSFDDIDSDYIQWIMDRLNNRPRKALNGNTPNEVFYTGKRIAFAS